MNNLFSTRKKVDTGVLIAVWNTFRTDITVCTAMRVLRSAVLSHDMDNRIRAFRKANSDAFDWLLCVGVVPIVFNKNNGDVYVASPESVNLYVSKEYGRVTFHADFVHDVSLLSQQKKNEDLICLVWCGEENVPTEDGNLTSIMYKIRMLKEKLEFMHNRALVSYYLLSNPPIVSEAKDTKNSDTIGAEWLPARTVPPHAPYTDKDKSVQEFKSVEEVRKVLHATKSNNWNATNGLPVNLSDFAEEMRIKEYFVPDDRRVVRREMPEQLWATFQSERHHVESLIFDMMGIPSSLRCAHAGMRANDNHSKSKASFLEERTFNATVFRFRCVVENFMNDCNNLIKMVTATPAVKEFDDDSSTRTQNINDYLYTSKANNPQQLLKLCGSSFVNQEDALQLFDRGVISNEECALILREGIGLSCDTKRTQQINIEKIPLSQQPLAKKQKRKHQNSSRTKQPTSAKNKAENEQTTQRLETTEPSK